MQNKNAYVWGLITKVAPAAIQIFTNMILARFLSPEDFGSIGVLTVIFTVANVLVDSGLGGSLVKEKDISRIDCSTIFIFNLTVSIILYFVIFFSASHIENFFSIDGLSTITRVLSLTFILGSIGLVPRAILIRNLKFNLICEITIISTFIAALCSIVMAYMGFGVYSLVANQLIISALTALLSIFSTKYRWFWGFSINSFKSLIPFGIFTSITSVIDTIYENLLTTLTGKCLNVSQAGYLSQAKKLEDGLSSSIASTIGNVSFPILTKFKEDSISFNREAISLFRTIVLFSFPILLTISLFSEQIVIIMFGQRWMPTAIYLQELIWAGLFIIMETTVRSYVKALCEVQKLMNATLVKRTIGIAIILSAIAINREWIIISYIISTVIGFIINMFLYAKISNHKFIPFLIKTCVYIIPPLLFYFLGIIVRFVVDSKMLCSFIVLAILVVYYLFLFVVHAKVRRHYSD